MDRTSFSQSRDRGRGAAGQGSVLTKLRLRDMELLLAIHEQKSITSAALQLGLTQPAASRALRDMEQLLRVHLFERDRAKGMSLTVPGELVLTRARALLADYRSMTMELDAYKAGTGGHLRLGVIAFAPGLLIGNLITELIGQRYRMSVSLTEGSTTQLLEDLRMQRLDAVIGRCSTDPIPAGFTQERLVSARGLLAGARAEPIDTKGTHSACRPGRVGVVVASTRNAQSHGDQRSVRSSQTCAARCHGRSRVDQDHPSYDQREQPHAGRRAFGRGPRRPAARRRAPSPVPCGVKYAACQPGLGNAASRYARRSQRQEQRSRPVAQTPRGAMTCHRGPGYGSTTFSTVRITLAPICDL